MRCLTLLSLNLSLNWFSFSHLILVIALWETFLSLVRKLLWKGNYCKFSKLFFLLRELFSWRKKLFRFELNLLKSLFGGIIVNSPNYFSFWENYSYVGRSYLIWAKLVKISFGRISVKSPLGSWALPLEEKLCF